MLRVLSCVVTGHDLRLVLLAAVICSLAAFTSFRIYTRATNACSRRDRQYRRVAWLAMTGLSTGAGIWSTHFVAMLAFSPGFPIAYDPALTLASLVIAIGVTTAGYLVAAEGQEASRTRYLTRYLPGNYWCAAYGRDIGAAVGGVIVGAGIATMHYTGMAAVNVPGLIEWDRPYVVASVLLGMTLAAAGMVANYRMEPRLARWVAPALLTLAICALHFTAMTAASVIPDPTIVVHPSVIHTGAMAIAVAGVSMLVMLAAVGAALVNAQAEREVERELRRHSEERRRSEAKIAHMALHDTLTGLPNRALLNERLEEALAGVGEADIAAVHLLDLDLFKNVNDTLGHPAGDELLKIVAARLHALACDGDTVARMSGDEFAIVQTHVSSPGEVTWLARRIIEALSEPCAIEGHQIVVGTSVGIAVAPTDGSSGNQLLRNADLALYRAKADGRGTYRFFEPQMNVQMQARRLMERDLRKALTNGEFDLYYQPIFDLERGSISGCEALLRWHHPETGMISPGAFVPVAEEIGLIVPLGEWIIREACATAARWPEHITVAVNLSPVQFRNSGLVQVVMGALAASCLPASRLEFEITETALLEDSAATLSVLHQLRQLGVHIAMDDFGTGYSSLSYLQSFPFDKIKIDRSFTKNIVARQESRNIVRAVVALANGLGMQTTAEGVETKEQLDAVKAEGCTSVQGFLLGQPRPAREIEQLFPGKREGSGIVLPTKAA